MTTFWWQRYGTVGQIAQAVVAMLGFVAILFQINVLAKNASEAGARQIYQAHNDLEFRKAAEPAYLKTYSEATQKWIATDMQQAGVVAPSCKPRTT